MFTLRFDMRAPAEDTRPSELYAAAIEMCAWAETRVARSRPCFQSIMVPTMDTCRRR